jgi:polyisoprenoid-binding protein YceI
MRTLILLLLAPSLLFAQVKKPVDKKKSTITYSMNHVLHAWDAVSPDVNGVVQLKADGNIEKVAIVAKISSFDSKSSNRDAHTLEVTEALKFPNISFVSTAITESKNGELDVKGNLQFHGVTKEISFKAVSKNNNGTVQVNGNFIFLLEDFKVPRPSFMLKQVDNEVKVKFEVFY